MKPPSKIYALLTPEGFPLGRYYTNKSEAKRVARDLRGQDASDRVVEYVLAPHTIWHWAAEKGTISRCMYAGKLGDSHASTDTYIKRVNCPRCMKTKAYKTRARFK